MAFIDFTNGEVLTADQMDTVMRQSVMKFADASARDTALSAVLAEGMMCYLDDTNEVLKYDGSSWIDISGDITGVTAGTALTGGGTSGNVTLDVDTAAVGSAISINASQISDVTATATELNYVDGVTSAIQTQIDSKQNDVITTQGDLIIGDASGNPVRLPVGSADQVLTSNGTTVSFEDAAAGGGMTLITSVTPSGDPYTISSIPQTYEKLLIRISGITVNNPGKNIGYEINPNGSSDGFFSFTDSTTGAADAEDGTGIFESIRTPNDASENRAEIIIDNYTDSGDFATVMWAQISRDDTATITSRVGGGGYSGSMPITSLQFDVNFNQDDFNGGTIELWGIN